VTTCPRCGEENPDRFRLCGFCGATLRETGEAEERKIISVLFVDLVGFTARSDRADPEDVRARLRPFHTRVKEEIERFGGTVEKFVGDAVMAVFGAPVAHEDDAERAVRAALRVQEAIGELNEADPGLGLALRGAVNTGEAVVATGARPEAGESIVAGDVVNTASRLQQTAPVGGVVVGEATYRATRDAIEYRSAEPVTVKGKGEPITVWLATGARSRFGSDLDLRPQAAFIGRTVELTLLQQTYFRAVAEPSIQLVTVTGEPGVGKSRLVREFFGFIDGRPELVSWRQGRCLPYGDGITFWALGEIVKAQVGVLESDGPEQAAAKLEEAVAVLIEDEADRDWVLARLGALVGAAGQDGGAPADRAESFAAWRRFLEALAASGPLVLVFEDLHWADPAMVEFVDHLVDWAAGVPMLVLCTARPELYERQSGWGGGKRNSATISLSPLSDEESARLVASLLSEAVLPADTQTALLERAGGNPLYAEEFVRMLTDRGILRREGRAWQIEAGEDIPVPDTVQSLIAARLDTLPPERKSLLHDAAVVGKVFWPGALASMGSRDPEEVTEGLHELSLKELVRPSRTSSVANESEFSFWHALVRNVAYSQIPRAARAVKHRAAAAWIGRLAGDRVTDHAEVLAHHYGQAMELARAAGDSTEAAALEEPVRRFLVLAGDRAFQLDASGAERFFRQAVELTPPGHPDRAALLLKLGRTGNVTGRIGEAEHDLEAALEAARPDGDPMFVGEIMTELSAAKWRLGNTTGGAATIDGAIDLLEQQGPSPQLAAAYVAKAGRYMLLSEPGPTLEWTEKALVLAERFGLEEHLVRLRQYRGMARWALGDLGGGDDLREALRFGLEIGAVYETTTAFTNLADFVWIAESPQQGLELQRRGIELADARGHVHGSLWIRAETTWLLYDSGRWDELIETADRVIAADQERGGSNITDLVASYRAKVLLNRGNLAEAAAMAERFLPRARENAEPQILLPSLLVTAMIRTAQGGIDDALELVEELQGSSQELVFRGIQLADASRICFSAGDISLAERLKEGTPEAAARDRHSLLTARALLAELRGETEDAMALFAETAEAWRGYGHPWEEAHADFGTGRCLVASGRQAEAVAPLGGARDVFAGLGATPAIAEVDGWLSRATARTS
jgi:class 3 adenylate cyclase/tetratricopeptide (TPR) repeat protein